MIKLTVFLTRRADLTQAQFSQHWKEVHAPLVLSQPVAQRHVRRYVQSHSTGTAPDGVPLSPYDGIAEMWLDDMDAVLELFGSDAYRDVIVPDEEQFLDRAKTELLLSTEFVALEWSRDHSDSTQQTGETGSDPRQ